VLSEHVEVVAVVEDVPGWLDHRRQAYLPPRLCRERYGLRPAERAAQLGEDCQVRVKLDALKATHAERQECPFVLEPSELALDRATAAI
jgi:hypothetical protein